MTELAISLLRVWLAVAAHLWQSTLVLAGVFLLSRALRRAPARFLHLLWSAALLKLFLPLSLLGGFAHDLRRLLFPGSAGGHAPQAYLSVIAGILDPITGWGADAGSLGAPARLLPLLWTLLWLAGIAWGGSRVLRQQRRASAFARATQRALTARAGRGTERPAPPVEEKLARVLRGTTLRRREIRLSGADTIPCVIGLLRPRILFPERVLLALPVEEARAVLLHEEAHLRRRDPLRAALLSAVSVPYFFYPLLGALRRRLLLAAELICDERVLAHGVRPEVYARALARTVRLRLAPDRSLTSAAQGGSFLAQRFDRLHGADQRRARPAQVLVLGAALALVGLGSLLPSPSLSGNRRAGGTAEDSASAAVAASAPAASASPTASAPSASSSSELAASAMDTPPAVISWPRPVYPPEAQKEGLEGTVLVSVLVESDGATADPQVAQGVHPLLDQAALESARGARLRPATLNGRPVALRVQVPVRFQLD